jgi:hypothetical protein
VRAKLLVAAAAVALRCGRWEDAATAVELMDDGPQKREWRAVADRAVLLGFPRFACRRRAESAGDSACRSYGCTVTSKPNDVLSPSGGHGVGEDGPTHNVCAKNLPPMSCGSPGIGSGVSERRSSELVKARITAAPGSIHSSAPANMTLLCSRLAARSIAPALEGGALVHKMLKPMLPICGIAVPRNRTGPLHGGVSSPGPPSATR